MQCPPDYSAVSAVVCLAAVVGRQLGTRPKQHDDWTVVPNLWGAVIGRPSLLKSPAIQEVIKVVDALEVSARAEHEQAQRHFDADWLVAEARITELKSAIAKAIKVNQAALAQKCALEAVSEPASPTRRRCKTQDTTVEKLCELLRDNPRGQLIYRDELTVAAM